MKRRGRPPHPEMLTPREQEVVDLVVRGLTNREAAQRLDVTEATVRYHLNQVYSKLGIDRREDLAGWEKRVATGGRESSSRPMARGILRPALLASGVGLGLLVVAGAALIAQTWNSVGQFGPKPSPRSQPAATTADASCLGDSILVPAGAAVSCLGSAADVQAAMPFKLLDLSSVANLQPERAAILKWPSGLAAYRSFVRDGKRLEVMETRDPSANLGADLSPHNPLVISIQASSEPRGSFIDSPTGPILWWCPDWVQTDDMQADDCGSGRTIGITGTTQRELGLLVYDIISGGNYVTSPGTVVTAGPTPIPFPALRGEHVAPAFAGLPVMPSAVEVDGFVRPSGIEGQSGASVQVFDSAESADAVLAWYETALTAAGWESYGGSYGVTGRTLRFSRGDQSEWIEIGDSYVARPDEETQPPPGFRGKGVPFASPVDKGSRTWVVTWTQEPGASGRR